MPNNSHDSWIQTFFWQHHGYVSFSPDVWSQIRQQATGIARMATYDPGEFTLSGTGAPEIVSGARVTGDFFSLLGVKPLFGRLFFLPTRSRGMRALRCSHGSYGASVRRRYRRRSPKYHA